MTLRKAVPTPSAVCTPSEERHSNSPKLLRESVHQTIENSREQVARSRQIIARSHAILARIRLSMAHSQQIQQRLTGGD